MVITVQGDNQSAIDDYVGFFTAEFLKKNDALALEKIEAGGVSYEALLDSVRSLPFLSDNKLVIIKDLQENAELCDRLEYFLSAVPDTTQVLIVALGLDKRSAAYKLLSKKTDLKTFNALDSSALVSLLSERFAALGISISRSDIMYLVDRVSGNQLKAVNEANKLAHYSTTISRSDIDLLTVPTLNSKIFELVDAIFKGNKSMSMSLYDEQRKQKVEPQAIFGLLVWQLCVLAIVAHTPASEQGKLGSEGVSPFVLKKSIETLRRIPRSFVDQAIQRLSSIDTKVKDFSVDVDYAMRFFIAETATGIAELKK